MGTPITGNHDAVIDLIEALGIPVRDHHVTTVDLHFDVGDIATATVTRILTQEGVEAAVPIVDRYEFHAKPMEDTSC